MHISLYIHLCVCYLVCRVYVIHRHTYIHMYIYMVTPPGSAHLRFDCEFTVFFILCFVITINQILVNQILVMASRFCMIGKKQIALNFL